MKENDLFKLEVITPERVLVSQDAASLVLLSGAGGSMGILPKHAPLIAQVNTGILKIRDTAKKETTISVSNGFIMVSLEGAQRSFYRPAASRAVCVGL